jgi:DNA invertase Pin-like site-specific DNA recombinase
VGYWRFSDPLNGNTIPQQQNAMKPRCRVEGVHIVRDFFGPEEGVSAKDMQRDEIDEMLAYCQQENRARARKGEPIIEAIVVFHHDRFSRAGSWETGKYLLEFGQAGVHKMLTHDKWYDFRKKEDRAIFNLEQDFANQEYLRHHAARVLRGKNEHARAGHCVGGPTNYGFDRLLVDDKGSVVRRIPRGSRVPFKDKGWRVELAPIPADDPDPDRLQERETVAYLYRTFADNHISLGGLAVLLNERKIPGPGRYVRRKQGRKTPPTWRYEHVRDILKNPMYCGLRRWGGEAEGDFYRLIDGEVTPCTEKGLPRVINKEVVLVPLRQGGIVDQPLWERVQEKLARESSSGRYGGRLCRGQGFILSGGLCYCGHCGARLSGVTQRVQKTGSDKVYVYRKMECPTYKRDKGRCLPYAVPEDGLIRALVNQLLEDYLDPARLEGLRAQLTEKVSARHTEAPEQVERLQAQLIQLDQDIVRARRYTLSSWSSTRACASYSRGGTVSRLTWTGPAGSRTPMP